MEHFLGVIMTLQSLKSMYFWTFFMIVELQCAACMSNYWYR